MSSRGLQVFAAGQSLPADTVTSTLIVYGGKGMGKRLALTTPLPTPTGWTTMGEVAVGDTLLDDAGQPCIVTAVSPVKMGDSHEVVFSDGSALVADSEHLWLTEDYAERKRGRAGAVRTTAEIAATLTVRSAQPVRNHAIRNAQPLLLPERALPLDPYVLGAWLGDGSSAAATITAADRDIDELAALVQAAGVEVRAHRRSPTRAPHFGMLGVKVVLRQLGVLGHKHVPSAYLRGSIGQRRALLAGLLDTDGTVARHAGPSVQFDNTNEALADAVYELVVSLGMKATRSKKRATLHGIDHGPCHRVTFVPTMQVFRLARKAALLRFDTAQQARRVRRYVVAVRPVPSVPMRCIAVDSPSRLYLAGEAMVPTHNTNLLSVLLEEMSKSGLRWCVVDPLGVLYGLRYGLDGKSPGVECLILGGVHGDIDIEPTGGEVVADLVADEDVNVIIDCSRDRNGQMWSVGQKIKFLTAFPARVFQQQGSLVNGRRRPPRFIGLDEAARYIPQNLRSGDKEGALCVSAWEQIVEEGRNVGLGVGLFTQRSARLNKSVAELADAMIAFRTTGPNSIDAITDWLGDHVEKSVIREHVEVIRKLPVGQALLVSPGWLEREEVVRFRARETFDSSATPKPGERPRRISGRGAAVDLDAYRQRMAATIQRADENDPRVLRKRIKELESVKGAVVEVPKEVVKTVEVPVFTPGDLKIIQQFAEQVEQAGRIIEKATPLITQRLTQVGSRPLIPESRRQTPAPVAPPARPAVTRETSVPTAPIPEGSAHQRVLDALAWWEAIGFDQPTKQQIGIIAGYRVGKKVAGHYANVLGALRSSGLIAYPSPNRAALTPDGRSQAGVPAIERTTRGLQAAIYARLEASERRILSVIVDAYPDSISKFDVGEAAGYEVGAKVAGHYANLLGRLRTLGLVSYPAPNMVKAEPVLFLEGR